MRQCGFYILLKALQRVSFFWVKLYLYGMNILYNQSHLQRNVFLGVGYVALGTYTFFSDGSPFLAGLSGIGVLYIGQYFYIKNRVWLELHPDTITYHGFFKKKIIPHEDIQSLTYFAGDYTIKAKHTTVVIDKNRIDNTAQQEIKTYFDALQLRLKP
jgi:hypothetical protein